MRTIKLLIIMAGLLWLTACASVPDIEINYDPAALRFEGDMALAMETTFVSQFPDRDSGQPNNRAAAEWLMSEFEGLGLTCAMQEWTVVNYSRPVPLNNVVCTLPGQSPEQIVLVAHHDQSPATTQGADNDGSGIAILLQLAQIFTAEPTPAYTLVFLSSDAEEYGMLGTGYYVESHPDPDQIVAALTLDNLGKALYDGVKMSGAGRLDGIGSLWLQRIAQESARAAGDLWVPVIESPVELMLTQAVPVSAWDQGPLVAAGVPAFGIGGIVPAEADQLNWDTYHTPLDTLEYQSAGTLHQSGRVVEATVRQLLTMEEFPEENGPYVYFGAAGTVLRGPALWLIFVLLAGLFFAGSLRVSYRPLGDTLAGWRNALPHFLGLWLPWVASALLLYLFVEVGLMEEFAEYPALAKDPIIFTPRWPAVILYLLGLGLFFWLGRKAAAQTTTTATFRERKSLALLIVGLAALYILIKNPFSLLFLLPVLVWFFIGGRHHAAWLLDGLLFLLGGLVLYVLLYFFGAIFLRNDFAVLWYVLMMFSIRMVGFWTMAVITAVVAAGTSLVVHPAVPERLEQAEQSSVVLGRA